MAVPTSFSSSTLTANPIVITVKAMEISVDDPEAAVGNIATVEIRWRRDADVTLAFVGE